MTKYLIIIVCCIGALSACSKDRIDELANAKPFVNPSQLALSLNASSYEKLLDKLASDEQVEKSPPVIANNYHFDYLHDEQGLLLRSSGVSLRLSVEKKSAKVQVKVNRLVKKPQKSSIFQRAESSCYIRDQKILQDLLAGERLILSLLTNECLAKHPDQHPIKIVRRILESEVLPANESSAQRLTASIKPIVVNRSMKQHFFIGHLASGFELELQKITYPKAAARHGLLVYLTGQVRQRESATLFRYLRQNAIAYSRFFSPDDDLTFLISQAGKRRFHKLIRSGQMRQKGFTF